MLTLQAYYSMLLAHYEPILFVAYLFLDTYEMVYNLLSSLFTQELTNLSLGYFDQMMPLGWITCLLTSSFKPKIIMFYAISKLFTK